MSFLLMVAATLRVSEATTAAILKYIETASKYISIITFVAVIASAGAGAIAKFGWEAFVLTVKSKIKKEGYRRAILW
ncbi:MAG: uberolysin/carnocyclin family circular bacteriocin [Brockia lithotrophica]|uniref:Circular bacteriocin, circularin A/uberolysin family n=1 Tax=Candidatus Carbonibacillus altaicus TaxID=2163959 RepID=A0A2R6XXG4_9BACL|nr:uberolysin/carnocyclin family circular bacteriocin [Brockia lithotrophica]PTQ55106.1 MAG: hypothetical protein BSOLF_0314 [Candidatus Carbobacillus altaicus]